VRTLWIHVTAPPRANQVAVTAGAETQILGAEIDRKRVPDEPLNNGGTSGRTFNYWSSPLGGLDLTLEVKGTEPLSLTATSITPGLPTIPGKSYRDRTPIRCRKR
jgi:hypothetical protein